MKRILLSALISLTFCCAARAATFYTPVSITSPNSTEYNNYRLTNLHQGPGVGYSAIEPHNAPVNDSGNYIGGAGYNWVTIAPNPVEDYYNVFPAPILIIDLGEDLLLTEISIWNYATNNTNGAKDFSLRFATGAEGPDGFGTSIAYNPSFEAPFDPLVRSSHPFSQPVVARYVEMTITDNWAGFQGAMAGGDRVGLGEIAFAAVPEPSATAALLAAGSLLAARRTRRGRDA